MHGNLNYIITDSKGKGAAKVRYDVILYTLHGELKLHVGA